MQTANVNVPIQVTGRHLAVTEPLKEYVIRKVEGLRLDNPRIIEAQVILEVQKYRHIAEVLLYCANHITIEATSQSGDLYAAIDEVISKVARRMRKFKTRILKHNRPKHSPIKHFNQRLLSYDTGEWTPEAEFSAAAQAALAEAEEAESVAPSEPPRVVEIEHYRVKPMFVDEAILQLEVSEHREFVVFTNAETEKVNVLYRHKSGGFGLIEPSAS